MSTPRRRRFPWGLVVAAFILVPLVEIYVIIQIGQVIGAWWTILLLIADSLLGSWLIKREGGRAWEALGSAIQEGRMPHKELADGILILVGGLLMLTPGFVLDIVGRDLHPAVHPPDRPSPAVRSDQPQAGGGLVPHDGACLLGTRGTPDPTRDTTAPRTR